MKNRQTDGRSKRLENDKDGKINVNGRQIEVKTEEQRDRTQLKKRSDR